MQKRLTPLRLESGCIPYRRIPPRLERPEVTTVNNTGRQKPNLMNIGSATLGLQPGREFIFQEIGHTNEVSLGARFQ